MKLPTYRGHRTALTSRSGFTLIEMIGVLAVIAILASMLIPRVFEAINSARVNSTAVACETIKTAAADHFGKYGNFELLFGQTNIFQGSTTTYVGYDTGVLMPEGLLDKPFSARIAGGDPSPTNAVIQLVKGNGTGPIGNGGAGYMLDGNTVATSTNASYLIEAVMLNVSQADAKDLNDRIDGLALGAAPGASDTKGRVEYSVGGGSGPVTVYVYITHR
ncbi:MAG TPA: type II secretion system protein [Verrucomicrobiae bacterium]|nr:type II secretion system protein [Verrucomicrobiae bacterium]